MTRGDEAVERAAARLDEAAVKAASDERVPSGVSQELATDAVFLRKLKPSLVLARWRGKAPTDGRAPAPAAPPGPQLGERSGGGGGLSPLLVIAAALAAGVLLAKMIDWRSHAHPRR